MNLELLRLGRPLIQLLLHLCNNRSKLCRILVLYQRLDLSLSLCLQNLLHILDRVLLVNLCNLDLWRLLRLFQLILQFLDRLFQSVIVPTNPLNFKYESCLICIPG